MLHVLGISLLMPPSGAVLAIVLLWAFQVRLALYEEATLTARLGRHTSRIGAAVPRFLPSPAAQVAGCRWPAALGAGGAGRAVFCAGVCGAGGVWVGVR